MMVDVNVFRILAVTHSVLCLVIWQSYAHSANYSNATGAVIDCIDREGHRVRSGERFAPDEDPCKTCYCVDGIAQLCTLVQCSPPSCPKWEPVLNQCCKFRCLDWPQLSGGSNESSPDDFDGPSFHLRLALSGTTSLLIIALLIFMVHRLRQRRLLIVMRRISEEQRCIGQDDSPCTADDVAGFDFLAYKEPPPPYSSPHQTLDRRFDPPPYDSMRADSGMLHDQGEVETGNYNDAATLSPVQSDEVGAVGSEAGFYSRV